MVREEQGRTIYCRNLFPYVLFMIIIAIAIISYAIFPHRSTGFSNKNNQPSIGKRVLVVYVYSDTHLFSKSNLEYFIHEAVNKSTNVDYYIILQQSNNNTINETDLPILPFYAHYIPHDDRCYYLGTIGWFLSSNRIHIEDYEYFIFLNSSARGPYLVVYYEYMQWYYAFTKRLNNRIKLVGATLNCEPTIHVESYFWAMDRQGLTILLKNGTIFACARNQFDAIYFREIPASRVIINAGFGIDVLMKKYTALDFRQKTNDICNNQGNASLENSTVLDPFETIFIKFENSTDTESSVYLQSRVRVYDMWVFNSSFV